MANHLETLNDPSQQAGALARGLQRLTSEESAKNIIAADEAIEKSKEKNTKCLETELRLVQLCFYTMSTRTSETKSELDTKASCERIVQLCRQFPDTAGRFLKSYKKLERALYGAQPLGHLYSADIQDLSRRWGNHKTGHLELCRYGHPYSTATFDGCPECGREVELAAAAERIDYESYMKNDEFLAQMRKAS